MQVSGNKVYFAKLDENAIIPSKKDEDAGYDIYACLDEDYIELDRLGTKLIPTAIAWACSPEYYLQIHERSGCGKNGMKYSGGVIDSSYRGEIKVAIFNATGKILVYSNIDNEELFKKYPKFSDEKNYFVYSTKKAIAQGVIHRVHKMDIEEISYDELLTIESDRKTGGFGSSNK